ncbi:MAG: amidohydrolase family protein [Pseudomonadota bacterium]
MLDIYNHFMPRAIWERVGALLPNLPALKAFPHLRSLLDVDERLKLMDPFDGLQQILSLSNPPIEMLAGPDATPELARIANDGLAEICAKHRDRFPAFIAALPLNNVDACLDEIDRTVHQLGARGIQIYTNMLGKPMSHPDFRPIFQKMAQLDLPVWIHPIRGPQHADYTSETTSENELWFTFGWPYETTACVTRLIFSRIFDELPTLKIITHHMGGMIPFYAGKIDLGFEQIFFGAPDRNPQAVKAGLLKPPADYYHMLYADTALNGNVSATRCGHDFFGTEHSLFATDAPFDSEQGRMLIRSTIDAVSALDIPYGDKQAIFSGNARRLLRLA